jgi:hypothetical protein
VNFNEKCAAAAQCLMVAGKGIRQCDLKKGELGRVCSSTGFTEEREKSRGRDGHGCIQDGGRRGGGRRALGSAVAHAREDTGEGLQRRQE